MKTFVLDTNVVIHDPEALYAFEGSRVVIPLPVIEELDSFKRSNDERGRAARMVARTLDKRVLLLASGGLSHQPPVPELAKVDARMAERLLGGGRNLPADERAARQQRVIDAARAFVEDPHSLHPLNPEWDQAFLDLLASGRVAELDRLSNADLSRLAGRSTHEVKTWVAA